MDWIKKMRAAIAARFPQRRNFDLQFEQFSAADYKSELLDNDLERETVSSQRRLKFAVNLPIVKDKNWNLYGSGRCKFDSFDIQNVTHAGPYQTYPLSSSIDYHYFSTGITAALISKLFQKPVIYTLNAAADGSEKGYERVKGNLSASMILKRSKSTVITAGFVTFLDRSSPFIALPSFSFTHQSENSPWMIDIVLPRQVYLRRTIAGTGRLSLGTELENESLYIDLDYPGFAGPYDLRRTELKTGAVFEYCLAKNTVAAFRAGIADILISKAMRKGESSSDYVLEQKQDISGFINFGISFNPFEK
ncbi:hypothetical protein ACFSJW_01690 [Flavobacterium artemisiae]|uniref:Outer membrane protein beta-barrel domain-containing protein n=2 Tax=Flavobacterium artemisiae TaxID=2126556 RepID=A0ABW4HIW5_9FLAO